MYDVFHEACRMIPRLIRATKAPAYLRHVVATCSDKGSAPARQLRPRTLVGVYSTGLTSTDLG